MENQIQNNSNQIQLFENNNFGKIRIISEGDTFWVVGKDILKALDYPESTINQSSNVFRCIPSEWADHKPIMVRSSTGITQRRNVFCLSEQGLYFFLGRSDKPKAQKFKTWFDQEVLPVLHPVKVATTLPEPVNSDVQLFENGDFGKIRVIMKDGDPWFVAKDVCGCLGINNHNDAISNLYPTEKDGVAITDPIGRQQNIRVISESGFYKLVLKSRKPEARRFQDWVTQEVLPSIRKTGSYSVNNNSQFNELTCLIKNVLEQNSQLNNKIDQLSNELQVMRPKVQFYDLYVESDQTGVDCKTAAKIIGKMGRNKLFAFLRRKNLIMYDNMPYQRYVNLGLFGIKYSKTGFPVLLITKKGVEKIGQLLDNNSSQ